MFWVAKFCYLSFSRVFSVTWVSTCFFLQQWRECESYATRTVFHLKTQETKLHPWSYPTNFPHLPLTTQIYFPGHFPTLIHHHPTDPSTKNSRFYTVLKCSSCGSKRGIYQMVLGFWIRLWARGGYCFMSVLECWSWFTWKGGGRKVTFLWGFGSGLSSWGFFRCIRELWRWFLGVWWTFLVCLSTLLWFHGSECTLNWFRRRSFPIFWRFLHCSLTT